MTALLRMSLDIEAVTELTSEQIEELVDQKPDTTATEEMIKQQKMQRYRKCVDLCQEHFGGAWKKVTTDEQILKAVKQLSGSQSNYLYVLTLPETIKPENDEPSHVMLRFYGQASGDHSTILKDSLVFAVLSERGLGPKLYGCFTGGRFEEYIPTRCLKTHELSYPNHMRQIATRMARFHLLDMPLSREPRFLKDTITRYRKTALDNIHLLSTKHEESWNEFQNLGINLKQETKWLLNLLQSSKSPVRFCHNDVHEGNLLKNPGNGDLVVIDFEYSGYNFRGYDVANHFVEWCYCYAITEPPFFTENLENYPSRQQQMEFFKTYLEACNVPPKDMDHEIKELRNEVRVFTLAVHYLWALWGVATVCTSDIEFDYMYFALTRFKCYIRQKEYLQEKHPHLLEIPDRSKCSQTESSSIYSNPITVL